MSPLDQMTTRDKLFLAGIRIFARKGFRGATVREICKEAGSANINCVNYYFGSKEGLYREILEVIFKEYDLHTDPDDAQKSAAERLRSFISTYCKMIYKGGGIESDLITIFVSEMARPSPFLGALVDQYNRPRVRRHLEMVRELLGPHADDATARNCLVSIAGQIMYYRMARPVLSRLFPGDGEQPVHARWAEHVFAFSMGGIAAARSLLEQKKGDTP
jgi:AcrR family transcriptional regulator